MTIPLPHDLSKIVLAYAAPIQTAAEIEEEMERQYEAEYQDYLEEQAMKKQAKYERDLDAYFTGEYYSDSD